MIKILGQLEENIGSDYYDFDLNDENKPDGYSEGLWSDGKRLMLNPNYMEINRDWAVLKRDLTPDSFRCILNFFRRMGCYNIPEHYNIPREPIENED